MARLHIILLEICLVFTINCAYCQMDDTAKWTKVHVVNGSSICKLYNINLHYTKELDTSWVITLNTQHSDFLFPSDTTTIEIPGIAFPVRYYEYDCNCDGLLLHQVINEKINLRKGENNIIKVEDFFIPPKWWQTWWFFLVIILSVVFLLWILLKYYTNTKLKSQNKELQQALAIQKERLRISADMHDDIGSGLLAVRLQVEMLYKYFVGTEMEDKFNTIHGSLRDITYKVREVIWSLDTEKDTLYNLIAFIQQQASRMFENSGLELKFQSLNSLPESIVTGENRRNIYLTIKEALHNILKHAKATHTEVTFSADEKIFFISIKDNGIGFTNAMPSIESMGLRSMNLRVERLNGTLTLSTSKSGTLIDISIPFESIKI
jgi:two-component sensor histidine kinase